MISIINFRMVFAHHILLCFVLVSEHVHGKLWNMRETVPLVPLALQTPPECMLQADSGSCKSYVKRFFFDNATGLCEPFGYGGCEGNANRFMTKEECLGRCYCTEQRCYRHPDSGSCTKNFTRYFFNITSGQCEKFQYGGCQGNGNRFVTLSDCSMTCQCSSCVVPNGQCSGYFYNKHTRTCRYTSQKSCSASQPNMFDTSALCTNKCNICDLPSESGPCTSNRQLYYYDKTAPQPGCRRFTWGGCGGNANMFLTEEMCQYKCGAADNPEKETGHVPGV
ncbi:carboxypeptidase inhibitor SmCI-like isoform X1 [Haliotis rufescens]|uniref:carboxypeptidase inhibitor SmCI-like isoform X1 n=1 Tax=Haliotis rufescens TaxID=6454 RepID=UPI001EAFEF03|nr:carboxypeptidase inhibitor SmCI-like isoform X1 [Haliotis rufescens]